MLELLAEDLKRRSSCATMNVILLSALLNNATHRVHDHHRVV